MTGATCLFLPWTDNVSAVLFYSGYLHPSGAPSLCMAVGVTFHWIINLDVLLPHQMLQMFISLKRPLQHPVSPSSPASLLNALLFTHATPEFFSHLYLCSHGYFHFKCLPVHFYSAYLNLTHLTRLSTNFIFSQSLTKSKNSPPQRDTVTEFLYQCKTV